GRLSLGVQAQTRPARPRGRTMTTAHLQRSGLSVPPVAARIAALDWRRITASLDAEGCATLGSLLAPEECRSLAALYAAGERFRSRVVMARHGFGRGEYKYFAYPLPDLV